MYTFAWSGRGRRPDYYDEQPPRPPRY